MGADLYINKIYDANHDKYETKFDYAVKVRNAFDKILSREIIAEISKIVNGGKTRSYFDDPKPVPEDMELSARLRSYVDNYNAYCKAQSEVTKYHSKMYERGYFRDSYNGTSLFWRLGLSWWNDLKDYTNSNSELTPEGAKKLLEKVKSTRLKPVTEDYLREHNCQLDEENTVKSWQKYFINKKRNFIRFLELAIRLNTNIYCST